MTATDVEIVPTLDRVLVLPDETKSKSDGGILLPDNAKEIPMRGIVLRVGPGKLNDFGDPVPGKFAEGDYVLYRKYQGIEVQCGERTLRILPADDIWAKIERVEGGEA